MGCRAPSSLPIPIAAFDWINVSSVTTLNSDGSRTEVFNNPDPWGYDTTTTTSATGLSKTVQMSGAVNDFDPMLTMNATDVTVLNADGSTTQTITSAITQTTSNSTGGTSKSVITTSDDGLSQDRPARRQQRWPFRPDRRHGGRRRREHHGDRHAPQLRHGRAGAEEMS